MGKDLYVRNIVAEVTAEEPRRLFSGCGQVTYARKRQHP